VRIGNWQAGFRFRVSRKKVGVSVCERGFERCYTVENGDALVGAVFEFYGAYGRGWQRAEPIEVRQQFGDGKRRYLEKKFSFAEQVAVAVLLAYNFGARPMEQAKGFHLVEGEILSEQLINIAELFIGEFVPTLRHDEVY